MTGPGHGPRERAFRVECQSFSDGFSSYGIVEEGVGPIPWANAYLESLVARGLSPLTVRTYAYGMLSVCRWLSEAALPLEDLTESHVFDFIRFLRSHARQRNQSITPRTINLKTTILRSVYSHCFQKDVPSHSTQGDKVRPFVSRYHSRTGLPHRGRTPRSRTRVKVPRTLVQALAPEAAEQFIQGLRTYRDLAIAGLMLFSGLRSGEVLALRIENLDTPHGMCRVFGKGRKQRVVPIAESTQNVIRAYLRTERPETHAKELFVSLKRPRRGCAMTRSGLRSLFRHHRKRSRTPQANPHRFRHTFASDMIRAGCSLPALQRLLGHSHIDVTMQYLHFCTSDLLEEYRRAVAQLEKIRKRSS